MTNLPALREAVAKPTPYYSHAGITIYHGDCRDILPHVTADVVVTDPPYGSGARRDAERQVRGAMLRSMDDDDWFSHDAMTAWGLGWFLRSTFQELRSALSEGSHLYVFTDWRMTPTVYGMAEASGLRVNHCLVWDKGHYGMGAYWRNQHENIVFASLGKPADMVDRGMGSVIMCPGVSPAARKHPTEKPLTLIRAILSAVPGDTVLDPFMGSGTTLVAAKQLGRRAIGIEIEERYCEIAVKRLAQEVLPLESSKPEPTQQEFIHD
jgi:site-specific DNA-methyltransferase (adenine-specific)